MGRTCFARALVRALAALLLATQLVAGQETVAYSKFMLFFDLLDQTGAISQEFAAADGDLCQVKGVGCENGEVVTMCVPLHTASVPQHEQNTVGSVYVMPALSFAVS